MLFNSFAFVVFLPLTLLLYSILRGNIRRQNVLIILASYVFYGWWDWRFLFLLSFSSVVDFYLGRAMYLATDQRKRKLLLYASLGVNLGLLGFFKYFNFFIDSAVTALHSIGFTTSPWSLAVILPVGISFYTFQTLSYTIDIYRKELKPTEHLVEFVAFVSFFPQLVAGPIERASHLLPQFIEREPVTAEDVKSGTRQILAGFFKKMVVADSCALITDQIFGMSPEASGSVLLLGAIFFAFQIYGDFSGYSDIGIGVARLMGFKLHPNFRYPYFSASVREFWQRWHISLSTWFRDYVYIPLGGSRGDVLRTNRNLLATFLISGLWHGANWTFVIWGGLNGVYLVIENSFRRLGWGNQSSLLSHILKVTITFFLITLSWVFFRSPTLDFALEYLGAMGRNIARFDDLFTVLFPKGFLAAASIGLLLLLELLNRKDEHFLALEGRPYWFRLLLYFVTLMALILLGSFYGSSEFIYFQF